MDHLTLGTYQQSGQWQHSTKCTLMVRGHQLRHLQFLHICLKYVSFLLKSETFFIFAFLLRTLGQTGQTGEAGKTWLTFQIDFPGNLWRAAFAILAMFWRTKRRLKEPRDNIKSMTSLYWYYFISTLSLSLVLSQSEWAHLILYISASIIFFCSESSNSRKERDGYDKE